MCLLACLHSELPHAGAWRAPPARRKNKAIITPTPETKPWEDFSPMNSRLIARDFVVHLVLPWSFHARQLGR